MNITKKIGWQKYEDLLESQMESPLLDSLIKKTTMPFPMEEMEEMEDFEEELAALGSQKFMVPVDDKLMENISLAQTFDCWMGHTNFNITSDIRDKLNKTEGVEVLKICSRYRFFLGIGRMFDFKDVRKNIENILNSNEEE